MASIRHLGHLPRGIERGFSRTFINVLFRHIKLLSELTSPSITPPWYGKSSTLSLRLIHTVAAMASAFPRFSDGNVEVWLTENEDDKSVLHR
jgi:hypothetical protein